VVIQFLNIQIVLYKNIGHLVGILSWITPVYSLTLYPVTQSHFTHGLPSHRHGGN